MKGSILDFLQLVNEKPDLAMEIVKLAAKYDFEFDDVVDDEQLDGVAGGTVQYTEPESIGDASSLPLEQIGEMDSRQKTLQTLSNILKKIDSTQDSLIDNTK